MKQILFTILLCCSNSLANTQLLRQIEASERQQVLEVACKAEMDARRIPVACLQLGRKGLTNFCVQSAANAKNSDELKYSRAELRILPKECVVAVNERLQDLIYKEKRPRFP